MRRFIDEYGLAILYAIIGSICLGIFALIFVGEDTKISGVIKDVVDNSTNQSLEVQYNINYDLDGGYFKLLKDQNDVDGNPVEVEGAQLVGNYWLISDVSQIKTKLEKAPVDPESNAKYWKLENDEKLWLTYTRAKSFALPHPSDKQEEGYGTLLFDGWTGSGLSAKARNAVIYKGSTGNKNFKANWTRGYYRIVYDNNLNFMKTYKTQDADYQIIKEAGYDIEAWMSGSTPNKVVEFGAWKTDNILISQNLYEFKGHKFKNWNTKPDGTGETYRVLSTVQKDLANFNTAVNETHQTVTLYAQWELIDYKIDYTTTELETASNKNPTTYRIIDTFKLNNQTTDNYQTVMWYITNPYAEDETVRTKHKFGTYSWTGDALADNEVLYEFENYTQKTDDDGNYLDSITHEVVINDKNYTAKGTWKDQEVSYGTYGDLHLYGYKTTTITIKEKHTFWTTLKSDIPNQGLSMDMKWVPTESKEVELKPKAENVEWSMTEKEILEKIQAPQLYDKISKLVGTDTLKNDKGEEVLVGDKDPKPVVFQGYRVVGLETEAGAMVFVACDTDGHNGNDSFKASNDIDFWTKKKLDDGTYVKTWNYGKNLELKVKWEPVKYLINLHSNY